VLIPLVPSSLAPSSPPLQAATATTEPLGQESYERWLNQFLLDQDEDEIDPAAYNDDQDDNDDYGDFYDGEEDYIGYAGERAEREGMPINTDSDSDLDDLPSLEDSDDSDPELFREAEDVGTALAEVLMPRLLEEPSGEGEGEGEGNMNEQEDTGNEQEAEEDGGDGAGDELGAEEEEEEETMLQDDDAEAQDEALNQRWMERTEMLSLTSQFTRRLYAIKKYRYVHDIGRTIQTRLL
jgi:hypothetical protein